MRWLRFLLQVGVLTALTLMSVLGHNRLSGDVVLALTPTHGLHSSDVVVGVLWLLGVLLSLPWRRGGASRPRAS